MRREVTGIHISIPAMDIVSCGGSGRIHISIPAMDIVSYVEGSDRDTYPHPCYGYRPCRPVFTPVIGTSRLAIPGNLIA
ncbi:MAG: hypothetical protein SCH66_08380 [Methanolobus sp.]|nr:hypothetical protein [Methanolobus sp.]